MTKNTAMTEQEKLSIVESKLRKRRLSAKNTSSLLRQHERLLTKISGRRPGRPPEQEQQQDSRFAEFTEPQRRVLRGGSLLGTLSEEDRAMWESIYRTENASRAQRPLQPKQDSPAPGMTVSDGEAYLRSQHQGRGVQASAPAQPAIQADVD